jgi:YesN/AraC family two-component response regulator
MRARSRKQFLSLFKKQGKQNQCMPQESCQITHAVGYKKSGNFSDAFHKNTGLLPHAYRKLVWREK